MKKKFMNFLEKLSRDEMRTISGGYDGMCNPHTCNFLHFIETDGRCDALFMCADGPCTEYDAPYCYV